MNNYSSQSRRRMLDCEMHFHGWLTRDFTIREISRSSNCYTCCWRMIPCRNFVSSYEAQVSPRIRTQIVTKDRGCLFQRPFRRPMIALQINQRSAFPIWIMVAAVWTTVRIITAVASANWPQWRLTWHFEQQRLLLLFTWERGTTVQFVRFFGSTATAIFGRLVDGLRRQPPSSG